MIEGGNTSVMVGREVGRHVVGIVCPEVRIRSSNLEGPATGYRRLKKIVLSVVNREKSKNRCRRL